MTYAMLLANIVRDWGGAVRYTQNWLMNKTYLS